MIIWFKFQSARKTYHHPALMSNSQTMKSHVFVLSIPWIVYCLSVLGGIWNMRVIAGDLVNIGENGVHSQDEPRYSAIRVNGCSEWIPEWMRRPNFSVVLGVPLDMLELRHRKRGVLSLDWKSIGKRTQTSNGVEPLYRRTSELVGSI